MISKQTILVVDDDNIELILIDNVLNEEYNVITCNNAYKALTIIKNEKIDLIIIDIVMPNIDGFEFTKKILNDEKNKDIPFIYVTSNDSNNTLKEAFKLGAKDYIQKPFNKEKLLIRIKNLLKTVKLEKEIKRKEEFYETILNMQSNMIAVIKNISSKKDEIIFANKIFLNFFNLANLEETLSTSFNLKDKLIENEKFFYPQNKDIHWKDELLNIQDYDRNVAFYNTSNEINIFRLSITKFEKDEYILSFTNITNTMKSKLDLEKKVNIDKLTGAYTREYLYKNINSILIENNKKDHITTLSFFDIDHFKNINDTFGHKVGDEVLKELILCIKNHIRNEDLIFRWGGEEFIFIITITDKKYLFNIIDNLREKIANHKFSTVDKITASFGTTIVKDYENIDDTILRADEAMYEAKNKGRNLTIIK